MDIDTTKQLLDAVYARSRKNLKLVREKLGKPLTLAEKILLSHLDNPQKQELERGKSFLLLRPDRVAMQDVTGQMALLQFMTTGKQSTAVPTTVHCDHQLIGQFGADKDLALSNKDNLEVYDFLRSATSKYGIGFWGPGAGIIHQVVLENYAFPGGLMIGTDSHTPNAGGIGMIACGVGGMDAVDVMAGMPWELKFPKVLGVKLTGELKGWTAPKDVILKLLGILTVKGGTNKIIEYFGEGTKSISCTGKATITNMGAELGATTSVFPFDQSMQNYLRSTAREDLLESITKNADLFCADSEVCDNPDKYYDEVIEIDLSTLEPHVVGPHTPDLARPISQLKEEAKQKGFALNLTAALIGSCTNSSYEDLGRAADIAQQALDNNIKLKSLLAVSPGSDQVYATIEKEGWVETFEKLGGIFYTNSCGPCIGQWKRNDITKGEKNSIITSFNRNFKARNDGSPNTEAFIAGPELVLAMGLSGRLDFDPTKDELTTEDGKSVVLRPPVRGAALPENGFVKTGRGYEAPPSDGSNITVKVDRGSDRLQLIDPFAPWDGKDFEKLPVLLKAKGKCTTDHISPAGPWLKYRGHLDKISDNMFLGANNTFCETPGEAINQLTGKQDKIPVVARNYKSQSKRWVAVGDDNYGEGSSREHAAMSPRYLGAAAVIVRSFARIHETNLKKQGVLPLVFTKPEDYDLIDKMDTVSIINLDSLKPNTDLTAIINHADGSSHQIALTHTLNNEQCEWFKAGSALSMLKNKS
ncbi:MAG: aconitate hydratase [Bacteriovoracaceae bacterium]|nr:aconitate hydratase [Bacteriovoracaceae bacterium]